MNPRGPGVQPSTEQSSGAVRPRPPRALLGLGAFGLAGLLAACSSSPTSSQSTSHVSTTTTHHSGRSTTTTTAAPPTTTTTTTVPVQTSTLCQPSELHLAIAGQTGAAGTLTVTVGLTNTSSATCTMQGYPGMQLLGSAGTSLPTTVVRGQGHFPNPAANAAPAPVSLAPGALAHVSIQYSDVPVAGETTCPSSAQAEVTPPTDTAYAVMTLAIAPCDHGTVHVSPVYT